MPLDSRAAALATQIGNDVQLLLANQGDLTGLNTTAKNSIVDAVNEVFAGLGGGGDLIAANNLSDLASAAAARTNLDVRSTAQITAEISAAIAAITLGSLGGLDEAEVDARVQLVVDSAPAALDTINELAAALGDDANFAATVATSLSNKVDFSAPQTKTTGQKLQACQNIGVGDPEVDLLGAYTTARDS